MSPAESVAEAKRLASSGRPAEARGLLQSAVSELAGSAEHRGVRAQAFDLLLQLLFAQHRDGRMSKLFRQYVADYCEVHDAGFDEIYLSGLRATRTSPIPLRRRDRLLLLLRQLERTLELDGLVAECGCFRGLSSYLLCTRLKRHDPHFDGAGYEIYDSFQGLSEPLAQDTATAAADENVALNMKPGWFRAALDEVRQALAPFPAIAYFPGWIPDAFSPSAEKRYRFVHVDVDLYQPTRDSYEYFWPRLVPGGVIVSDDYNWPGAKLATEEFCRGVGVAYEVTPQMQAFFSRPA